MWDLDTWPLLHPAQALVCSATLLATAGCRFFATLYTSYHYNTNPSSPTVTKTQTPRHQPVPETQPPGSSPH